MEESMYVDQEFLMRLLYEDKDVLSTKCDTDQSYDLTEYVDGAEDYFADQELKNSTVILSMKDWEENGEFSD